MWGEDGGLNLGQREEGRGEMAEKPVRREAEGARA
jgi:hypothetical protein